MAVKQGFAEGAAVVTGAGSGIGEGIARHAASLGMHVMLADVAIERARRVAADIRDAGGSAMAERIDVRIPGELDQLAARAYDKFGDVRLLVNNAGIETVGYSWEIPAERWEETLDVNIHGVIHGVRAFVPRMLASGKPAYIANVASIGALGMMPVQTAYILSKHAVLSFTECLRLEMSLLGDPISISCVLPGPVATRIFEDANRDDKPEVAHHRKLMHDMLASEGITPLEAGRIILDGIAAKNFWVSTHPEITAQMAKDRAAHLADLTTPELTERTRSLLPRRGSVGS
ncbi:MAG TPA: SDR family NAD(P)-dependent oxidoreductase [Alphaproteobacteria bacterium]|nr:SDR family NAD(P)-dependent oxidoreductase [Alphaproteobacteria bacterium]